MFIWYDGHVGQLDPQNDNVFFYGVRFSTITYAVQFLRGLEPSESYAPWCYGSRRGVRNTLDDWVFYDNQWFPDEDVAADHIIKKRGH